MTQPYYTQQLFFCTMKRDPDILHCGNESNDTLFQHAKNTCKNLGIYGKGKIHIAQAKCLGRCASGPILVIYPQSIWYTYHNKTDIEQIIQTTLIEGGIINRLRIQP